MNKVMLIGRITHDFELRKKNDMGLVSFVIAVNERKDKVDFIPCVAFGKTAELVDQLCIKGTQLGITGRISTSTYEKNGARKTSYAVIVESFNALNKLKPKAEEVIEHEEVLLDRDLANPEDELIDEMIGQGKFEL